MSKSTGMLDFRTFYGVFAVLLFSIPAHAAISGKEKLEKIRSKIKQHEALLNSDIRREAHYGAEIERLEKLMRLQTLEIELSRSEMQEIEVEAAEMEQRKDALREILTARKSKLREHLSRVYSLKFSNSLANVNDRKLEMRKMHKQLIDTMVMDEKDQILLLREIEAELTSTEEAILEKKNELEAQMEDLRQKQSVLALNAEIQNKHLKQSKAARLDRLRKYEEIKSSEVKLSNTMDQIQQKREMVKQKWAESIVSYKGKLELPLEGKVVTRFGKRYDPKTNLYSFHKGISIATKENSEVRAIFPGKVVFSGRLGGYRQLIIIDHGKDYFSLVAQLGERLSKVGDEIKGGDVIGKSSAGGTPVYFEIRKRHVAIDPVPWLKL